MEKIINLSNFVTSVRIILAPICFYLIIVSSPFWALAIFVIAILTDGLDGYLARKLKTTTKFGKNFDPIADSTLIYLVFLALFIKGYFDALFLILLVIAVLTFFLSTVFESIKIKKISVPRFTAGRITCLLFYLMIVFFLLELPLAIYFGYLAVIIRFLVGVYQLIVLIKK